MDAEEVKLEQGTPAWHQWRDSGIGSSDASALLGMFGGIRKKKANAKKPFDNWAMARGRALEPHARVAFIERTGVWVRPSCWQHSKLPFLRASLDGISDCNKLMIEIKCGGMKLHTGALNGEVPKHYNIQMQHQMLVLGHKTMLFWSYNPDHPEPDQQTACIRVQRDNAICDEITEKAIEYMREIGEWK